MVGDKVSLGRAVVALVASKLMIWAVRDRLIAPGPSIENYIEHGFQNGLGERFAVSIIKPGRSTPHELRREAEAEAKMWKESSETAIKLYLQLEMNSAMDLRLGIDAAVEAMARENERLQLENAELRAEIGVLKAVSK